MDKKLFVIVIAVGATVITTLFIVFSQTNTLSGSMRRKLSVVLIMGILLLAGLLLALLALS